MNRKPVGQEYAGSNLRIEVVTHLKEDKQERRSWKGGGEGEGAGKEEREGKDRSYSPFPPFPPKLATKVL